jgi:biotin operon repressor
MTTTNTITILAEDTWLSEPDLRARLGFSRSTIRRLRERGLPHIGRGQLRRYHLPTVLQWLSEYAQDSQTAAECVSGDHDPARPGTRFVPVAPVHKRED